ncbi:MAG TPA: Uma2 family endonuclease [Verrucomicrobiae bacterium]|nr:Uma2 family endonuclease [Verrucomicrobiae bacterium]
MASPTLTKRGAWTDQELEDLPADGHKYELLNGRLIMSPVPANHGAICVRLILLIGAFVQRHKLGEVYDSSTGFRTSESILLSPDVSFVSKATLKKVFRGPDKFLRGAPDLAIEVLSPSDRTQLIHKKLDLYFEHGTRLVWIVNWKLHQVHIYRPDSISAVTQSNDLLSGDEVLPGFKCRLHQIFPKLSR